MSNDKINHRGDTFYIYGCRGQYIKYFANNDQNFLKNIFTEKNIFPSICIGPQFTLGCDMDFWLATVNLMGLPLGIKPLYYIWMQCFVLEIFCLLTHTHTMRWKQ